MASGRQGNFSVEFREQMVALYLEQQDAKTLSQVAREHGIGPETLGSCDMDVVGWGCGMGTGGLP